MGFFKPTGDDAISEADETDDAEDAADLADGTLELDGDEDGSGTEPPPD